MRMQILPLVNHSTYQPPHNDAEASERTGRQKRGIADTSARWPDGVVTVALDLKDMKSQALVVDAIREWAHHTPGLQLKVVNGKKGDIRVSDDEGIKGNWSYIGTNARYVPMDKPTMHLNRSDNSKEFRQTALHEFGHALGLLHEHQHPEHDINWNSQLVYAKYKTLESDKSLIDRDFFTLPTGENLLVKGYDTKSVMHYGIEPDDTKDGRETKQNYSLSEGDKEIIRKLYSPGRFQDSGLSSAQGPAPLD
ncbi:M12 family metallopeptidase [Pseudomonas poae]|uniref:Peptidase M12A astacin n=1 Tax=Pseudomonas poae TaxID=200451 RepID=A0A2S9EV61_9PSED|nr:M12 family metallopeptidase [Pseudomonas poae]PRA29344.1 peptidase M12A astacin [Pseudomonas poae]PRC20016.1 peptidase M12A astacin [Pseudomonas poae]